jgi:hypothetical protein
VRSDRAHDVEPIGAQIRFAADQRHLAHAELGHLPHEVQAFFGRQLVRPRPPGAGTAMTTREIAGERDLPDRIDRPRLLVLRARLGERQAPLAYRRMRRERQPIRSRALQELSSLCARKWIEGHA